FRMLAYRWFNLLSMSQSIQQEMTNRNIIPAILIPRIREDLKKIRSENSTAFYALDIENLNALSEQKEYRGCP
ncbi:MAG TPA: hypothetical protein VE089_00450, partial [Nitrososphaeraceae archaeon]|nr:hypothetical protein [Nitrososphaeraceae archaeon]